MAIWPWIAVILSCQKNEHSIALECFRSNLMTIILDFVCSKTFGLLKQVLILLTLEVVAVMEVVKIHRKTRHRRIHVVFSTIVQRKRKSIRFSYFICLFNFHYINTYFSSLCFIFSLNVLFFVFFCLAYFFSFVFLVPFWQLIHDTATMSFLHFRCGSLYAVCHSFLHKQ